MAIDLIDANTTRYYSVPDSADWTFPNSDWFVYIWTRVDDNSGALFQYLFSNNNFSTTNSLNILLEEGTGGGNNGKWQVITDTLNLNSTTAPGGDGVERLVLFQRNGSNIEIRFCEAGQDATSEGSAAYSDGAINGSTVNIGRRVDGNTGRYYEEHFGDVVKGSGSLSLAQITLLGKGVSPVDVVGYDNLDIWLQFREATSQVVDIINGNIATRNGSGLLTSEHFPFVQANISFVAAAAAVVSPSPRILPKRFHPDFRAPRVKPLGLVEIDWSNSLSKGLIVAMLHGGDSEVNLLLNNPLDTINTIKAIDINGRYSAFKQASSSIPTKVNGVGGTNPRSAVVGLLHSAMTGDNLEAEIHSWGTSATSGDVWTFRLESNLDGNLNNRLRIAFTGGTLVGSTIVADDTFHIVGYTFPQGSTDGSDSIFYIDGDRETVYNQDTAPTISTVSNEILVGQSAIVTNSFQGQSGRSRLYFTFIWDRDLSDREHQLLSDSPYQILKPKTPPVYFVAGDVAAPSGRIMSSLANAGGLAGLGGIAGPGGGLAG